MANDLIVVKANSLIEASYRLSIDEIRVLALTVGTIDPSSNQQIFDFTVADVVREFPEVKVDNAYKQIQVAIKKLYDRTIRTEDSDRVTDFRWVSSRTYFKKEGRFRIALTNEVMPYLTQLKGQFTQYQLRNISSFNSVHAIRIYELCMQYKNIGEREISVANFKKWLQVEDKYPRYNNFKQWVIDPSIDEINEKSDIAVTYEPIKRGRKIVGLKFIIQPKKEKNTVKKTLKLPNKSSFGKYTKLDRQNPAMSSAEYANYAYACIKILDDFYDDIGDVTNEHLRNYWVFLAVNASHRSKLGSKQKMLEELRKRGFKLIDCELVKIDEKQIDLVDDLKS